MAGRLLNKPLLLAVAVAVLGADVCRADPPAARAREYSPINRICDLIAAHADDHHLPRAFLARLLWKESRFDRDAVSPKGAEGIAQFMPGTAKMRGLADAFDIEHAIPASAHYLAELSVKFGNLGLAAAAYNSGEARVSRWLSNGGFLPLETENFVLDIMGEPVDGFVDRDRSDDVPPLDADKPFSAACRDMPAARSATVAMASVPTQPWGIQVAGSFNRAAAIRRWQSLKVRHAELLENIDPVISRVRSPIGRRGIHAVRIGAESRAEAANICTQLRSAGGACVVSRNR